ncbi:hypothetical protein BIV24_17820 [Streptomyces colonosanans]|uniref:Uncharacterized protein n=1 Tax=Streptomyces colonosanans TaxID=1428652 RepID=A0A1S2PA30_9ACTN|nr:hypothetical protein BIV24_17820 [Streptomyces colonosanans]
MVQVSRQFRVDSWVRRRLMRSIMATWIMASERSGWVSVVAGESAVVHEPAEGPLDDPASRDHFEPFDAGGALDDFGVWGHLATGSWG